VYYINIMLGNVHFHGYVLKHATFRKLDPLPSSGEYVGTCHAELDTVEGAQR
jgi:hypothetical protein